MKEEQARQYFEDRLAKCDLFAGSNYMIDAEDTVWWCEVWVLGGIWFIKSYPYEPTKKYHEMKCIAELRKDTQWQERVNQKIHKDSQARL